MPKGGAGVFYVDGLEEILAELKTLEARVAKKIVRPVLRKSLKPIAPVIQENAPVGETGALKEQKPKIRASKKSRKRIGLEIGYGEKDWVGKTWYAAAVEFGTSKMQAKGFMRKAFDEKKSEVARIIIEGIGKGLLKEANRNKSSSGGPT